MKIKKSVIIVLVLILIMIGSTFVNLLYSFFSQPKLPEVNDIDYELTDQEKNLVLRQGKVLLEFFYGSSCKGCQNKISFLDFLANQYKDKSFLEKILVNESTPKLNILGFNITQDKIYLDERYLEGENITEQNVKDILCEVMIVPPVECAKV